MDAITLIRLPALKKPQMTPLHWLIVWATCVTYVLVALVFEHVADTLAQCPEGKFKISRTACANNRNEWQYAHPQVSYASWMGKVYSAGIFLGALVAMFIINALVIVTHVHPQAPPTTERPQEEEEEEEHSHTQ